MRKTVVVAIATLLAASARAEPKSSPDLREMFSRELDGGLSTFPVEVPGGIKGSVEAKGKPVVKAEGPEIAIPLGTALPVTCTVASERLDAGASTWRMATTVGKQLKLLSVRPVAIVAVAGSALVFTDIVYQATTEKGPMVGQLKIAVYAHDGHSLLCHHDEPGYSQTFQRVVGSLAGSMEGGGEDERAGARYAEIAVMRIGGVPVGYAETVVWDREGGGHVEAGYETQLMPRSETDLVAIDAYRQEASGADALLEAGKYVHVTNGEVESQIELSRAKAANTFRYEGQKQGKKLAGTFKTKAGLASDLWFSRRFDARSGYGPAGEVRHEGYSFTANPAGATIISCRKDAARPRRAQMSLGAMRFTGELDENGLFRTAEVPVGPTKLVIERVWSRGTL